MEERRLSDREQHILEDIEALLRKDRKLNDRLRDLRVPWSLRLRRTHRRFRGIEFCLLALAAAVLGRTGAVAHNAGCLIACAVTGVLAAIIFGFAMRDHAMRSGRTRRAAGPPTGPAVH